MALEHINLKKKPIILIDKSLNKLDGKVLFPDKLEKANSMIKEIGLPKSYTPVK